MIIREFKKYRRGVLMAFLVVLTSMWISSCKEDKDDTNPDPVLPQGWTEMAPMPEPRTKHVTTMLADGRVLICGGEILENGQIVPTRTSLIYDPSANTWTPTGSMVVYRVLHNSVTLKDGRVLVWGGYNSKTGGLDYLKHGEVYDPATGQWTLTPNGTSEMGPYPAMVSWDNGMVSIIGRTSTTRYNPQTNKVTLDSGAWAGLLNMNGVTCCHVNDSNYLLYGGDAANGAFSSRFVAGTKVVDRTSKGKHSWSSAIRIKGNRVLALGGYSSVCEVYDYGLHQWTTLPPPPIVCFNVCLFNKSPDQVTVFGDRGVMYLDVNSMQWSVPGSPEGINWGSGRSVPAVQLSDGSYFVCGGVKAQFVSELINRSFIFKP